MMLLSRTFMCSTCQRAIPNTTVAIAEPKIRTALFRHMRSLAQSVQVYILERNSMRLREHRTGKEKVKSFLQSTCSVRTHQTVAKGGNTMYRWLFLIGLILLVLLASGSTESTYAWDGHGRSTGHGYRGHGGGGYGYSGRSWGGHGYSGHGYRDYGYSGRGCSGRGYRDYGYSGHGYSGHGYRDYGYSGQGCRDYGYRGHGGGGYGPFFSPWSLLIPPLPIPVPVPVPPFGCGPY